MGVPLYEKGTPFVRHAGCPVIWRMRPYFSFSDGKVSLGPFVPEPYPFEDWPDWAKEKHVDQVQR